MTEVPNGMQFVCEVPVELGRVTGLEVMDGKIIAHTESGRDFLVPREKVEDKQ